MKYSRKKRTIFRMFLKPLIALMLVQSLFTLGVLAFQRTRQTIQDYSVSMMSRMVENRKVILQNDMTQRWASVSKQDTGLNLVLKRFLRNKKLTMDELLDSEERKEELLEAMFPVCMDIVENKLTTGIFMIYTGEDPEHEEELSGFFLRDSNPLSNPVNYSDLLMERGNKYLSRKFDIPLDTYWTTFFQMKGHGKRQEDNFFYEPWCAAIQYPQADMQNLGYWSAPFVLEAETKDSHEMVTYSVPLCYEGKVYGILGVEVSVSYLYGYLPVEELNENEQAGYAIAAVNEDGSYTPLLGKGVLYNAVKEHGENFTVSSTDFENLSLVDDVKIGRQGIYTVVLPLNLYNANAPYEDSDWVLIGFNEEEDLFGMSQKIYIWVVIALAVGLIFGLIAISFAVHRLTIPVKRLMSCIKEGRSGIMKFRPSNILEVDALYEVIKDLTVKQKEAEDALIEETELYRLILKNSQDTFFSYDINSKRIDIINDSSANGREDCPETEIWLKDLNCVHPEDREQAGKLLEEMPDVWNLEFRYCREGTGNYRWISLEGNRICDAEGNRWKVVGRFRDIQEEKEKQEKEMKKITTDGVTGFFSYFSGMQNLDKNRDTCPHGAMICFSIENLCEINEQNGITFGDMILEEFGRIVRAELTAESIAIRFQGESFYVWVPNAAKKDAKKCIEEIFRQFLAQFDRERFKICLHAGIVLSSGQEQTAQLIRNAKQAEMAAADTYGDTGYCFYDEINGEEYYPSESWQGKQLVTAEYGENVNLVSLALTLFGRGDNFAGQMQLMLCKIGHYFGAEDVYLVTLRWDFHTLYTEYEWHRQPRTSDGRTLDYEEEQWNRFAEILSEHEFFKWEKQEPYGAWRMFCHAEDSSNGYAIPLYDNGSVMGMLSIQNISGEKLESGDEVKILMEIVRVIQSQLNQERHDLASKAKTDFLSRMSHEIRTPMNGIIGMTAIALQKNQPNEKIRDCLQKIQISSDYLLGLINDILEMSKIESGKMYLNKSDFSMTGLLDTVAALIRPQAAEKSIEYIQDIHLEHDWFLADKMRISQILINLLGNAVKFTPEYGKVVLTIREEKQKEDKASLYFSVKDTGIGIPEEDRKRVFRSFEQTRENTDEPQKGTGLGLSISSRLIKLMGSTIELKSEPGAGSDFYFTLSLPFGTPQEDAEEEQEISFKGCRILVAEDNELNAEIAQSILEERDFKVDCVYDGAQAVERIAQSEPGTYDLILMDIMMPVMDGMDAARAIRSMEREDCRTIPIIAMSANVFDDDMKKSVECGMNGHLSKPVEIDKLYKMLSQILKK